jgi:hypothetical protein
MRVHLSTTQDDLLLQKCVTRGRDTKWNGMKAKSCTVDLGKTCTAFMMTCADMHSVRLIVEVMMTVMDATGTVR